MWREKVENKDSSIILLLDAYKIFLEDNSMAEQLSLELDKLLKASKTT